MAFTKTSNPYWYVDDTLANVTALLASEKINSRQILAIIRSNTAGQVMCIVKVK